MRIRFALILAPLLFWFVMATESGCVHHAPAIKPGKTLPGGITLGWPVDKGVLFRTFDQTPSRIHEGLSIGAPLKTSVRSAQDGEVIFASDADNDLGRMVIIKHEDPFVSIYGHLDQIFVKVGQHVKKGEYIGTLGTTGGVESPRVFFQLRKSRLPIDPEPYFSERG